LACSGHVYFSFFMLFFKTFRSKVVNLAYKLIVFIATQMEILYFRLQYITGSIGPSQQITFDRSFVVDEMLLVHL